MHPKYIFRRCPFTKPKNFFIPTAQHEGNASSTKKKQFCMETKNVPLTEFSRKKRSSSVGEKQSKTPTTSKRRKKNTVPMSRSKTAHKEHVYEVVGVFQHRSITKTMVIQDCPVLPKKFIVIGSEGRPKVTTVTLHDGGMTPREFFLQYVGWVCHYKDRAARAVYKISNGEKPRYGNVDKPLLRYLTLSSNCYEDVFESQNGKEAYKQLKTMAAHIRKYKTMPYDKMTPALTETITRVSEDGVPQKILMYRIDARNVLDFLEKMETGNTKFSKRTNVTRKPTVGVSKTSSSRANGPNKLRAESNALVHGNATKENAVNNTPKKRRKRRYRRKTIHAKPVALAESLKKVMKDLAVNNSAFSITGITQKKFCNSVFARKIDCKRLPVYAVGLNNCLEKSFDQKGMNIMIRAYTSPGESTYRGMITEHLSELAESCLTYSNSTLYDSAAHEKDVHEEDIAFADESNSGECDSEEYSVTERSRLAAKQDLENLKDSEDFVMGMTRVRENTLRSGKERSPVESSCSELSEEEFLDTPVVVPQITERTLEAGRINQRTQEKERKNKKRKDPPTPIPTVPKEQKKGTKRSTGKTVHCLTRNYKLTVTYKGKLHEKFLDNVLDETLISYGKLSQKRADSRMLYIEGLQSLFVEYEMSHRKSTSLIHLDTLDEGMEHRFGSDPDFGNETKYRNAQMYFSDTLTGELRNEGYTEKEAPETIQELLCDILLPIYYAFLRPQVLEEKEYANSLVHEEETSRRRKPVGMVSSFVSMFTAPDEKKSRPTQRRKLGPTYGYFIGNEKSIFLRWLDQSIRNMFKNEEYKGELFEKAEDIIKSMKIFHTHSENDARNHFNSLLVSGSKLPIWEKYSGTVFTFIQHMFPIEYQTKDLTLRRMESDCYEKVILHV